MKKIFAALLALVSAAVFGATLNPIQLLNPTGSTAGQAILSTGASGAPAWGNVSISTLTGVLPVANGGTNASSASGTSLDNITGFSGTGFVKRTGAGAYTFIADPLPLANGGTGQTTASAALSALGGAPLASPTFTGTPAAPTAAAATNTTQIATTAYVLANCTGVGQSFTNVTASRVSGTSYTNSTGRPIVVYVNATTTAVNGTLYATIAGVANVPSSVQPSSGIGVGISVVVPAGATYSITGTNATIANWYELR